MRRAAAVALLAVACHRSEMQKPREEALRHDLVEMRKAIADFHADQKRGPHSLSELKASHYLRDIPIDPITQSRNWRVTTEEAVRNDDFAHNTAAPAEPELGETLLGLLTNV